MRVLVTGSAGFVGRELVPRLQDEGHQVIGIDLDHDPQADQGIVHDLRTVAPDVGPFDACIHLASTVGGILFNLRRDLIDDNARITATMIELCRRAGCQRLAFVSSINVFETSRTFHHGPLAPELDQVTPYARSKAETERALAAHFTHFAVVRPTNIFGRKQRRRHATPGESHVIPELLAKIEEGGTVAVLGDGSQVRNFVHVADVCAFLAASLRWDGHHYFNVRSDVTITIRQLVEELLTHSARGPLDVRFEPEFLRHERFRIENFDLTAPEASGWRSTVGSIAEGLRR